MLFVFVRSSHPIHDPHVPAHTLWKMLVLMKTVSILRQNYIMMIIVSCAE